MFLKVTTKFIILIMHQDWLKSTQWFWRRWKGEQLTTDKRQILIRKAHLNLQLRWNNKQGLTPIRIDIVVMERTRVAKFRFLMVNLTFYFTIPALCHSNKMVWRRTSHHGVGILLLCLFLQWGRLFLLYLPSETY